MREATINLSEIYNHKIFYDFNREYDDDYHGVIGMGIRDPRYKFNSKKCKFEGVEFYLNGEDAARDNLICQGQHIDLEKAGYSKVFILGFNELGNYSDKLLFLTKDYEISGEDRLFLNGFNQIVEGLYESELDNRCNIADSFLANDYIVVNIYISEIVMPDDTTVIVLPNNPEMHILAISVM